MIIKSWEYFISESVSFVHTFCIYLVWWCCIFAAAITGIVVVRKVGEGGIKYGVVVTCGRLHCGRVASAGLFSTNGGNVEVSWYMSCYC